MPYALIGLGVHKSKRELNGKPGTFFSWSDTGTTEYRSLGSDEGSGLALGIGGGLEFPFGDNFLFGAEYRFEYLADTDYETNSLGKALGLQNMNGPTPMMNFHARVGYKF